MGSWICTLSATPIIAGLALIVAIVSIVAQRSIAKKRAAIDFFLKTEMDANVLDAYTKFSSGADNLRTHLAGGGKLDAFALTSDYQNIRAYLNLHELMAVGVAQGVFDNGVCYEFWSGELDRAYERTRELIEYIQQRADEPDTYCELVTLAKKWAARWKKPVTAAQ